MLTKEKNESVVVAEVIQRDEPDTKQERKKTGNCCVRTWSICLNGIEAICSALSYCCIGCSGLAMSCNKCLEEIDCDRT